MSLYKCTADSLYILRSAVTCVKSTFCSIPFFFGLEMFVTLSYFMQHVASTWQQPLVLRLQNPRSRTCLSIHILAPFVRLVCAAISAFAAAVSGSSTDADGRSQVEGSSQTRQSSPKQPVSLSLTAVEAAQIGMY